MTIATSLSYLQNLAGAVTTATFNAGAGPITFSIAGTEHNRIDGSGNSLFGYTTSQGSFKVQVNGNLFVGGNITGNLIGNVTGTVNTASNLAGGVAGQLVYQVSPGISGFINTSSVTVGTATNATNLFGGSTGSVPYQSAVSQTALLAPGTAGQILQTNGVGAAPSWVSPTLVAANTASNLAGGVNGSVPYQTGPGTTAFVTTGTLGQLFQSNSPGSAPSWISTSTLLVGFAVNDLGGSAMALRYQSAVNTSAFLAAGTANQILQTNGTGSAPSWISTGTMVVGIGANLLAGVQGQIPYQTGPSTTAFITTGTNGQILQFNGPGNAPGWVAQSTLSVGTATNANNLQTVQQTAVATYFPTFVDSNNVAAGQEAFFTTSSFTINAGTGAVSLAGALAVNNSTANTVTNTSNAIYTAGGAWIDRTLVVGGEATFRGSVVFQGTNTFVYSSSTVYTDNLLSLHAPLGSGPGNHTWTVDDGRDIGFMFHYFKGSDRDAFLGWSNSSQFLEWYSDGAEFGGVFSGTTYGSFRTGAIALVNSTPTNSSSTGALTVTGGLGVGGGIFANGVITATNFIGAHTGNLTGNVTGNVTGNALTANTATALAGGTAGAIPFQNAVSGTTFLSIGNNGFVLTSNGTAPVWTALGGISAGSATTATNLAGGVFGSVPYQTAPGSTAFVTTGTLGQLFQSNTPGSAPSWVSTSTLLVGISANLLAGVQGQISYQTGPSTTAFITTGTLGQVLQFNGPGVAPGWVNTSSLLVGLSTNLLGGVNGSVPYQSAPNTTAYVATGTLGQLFQSNSPGLAPSWISTSTLLVGLSANLLGGVNGSIPYQTAPNATAYVTTGTLGQLLQSNSPGLAPSWVSTTTMIVGFAVNDLGGSAMALRYQSAVNTSAFLAAGTAGQILQTNGTGAAPTWVNQSTLTAGTATNANNLATVQTTTNAAHFVTFVDSNNVSSTQEAHYTTSSFSLNPATGIITANNLNITTTATVFGIVNSTSTTTGAMTVAGGVGIGQNLTVGGAVNSVNGFFINGVQFNPTPTILNDVSNWANGYTTVFPLSIDQTPVTGIVDNRDLQVMVNGAYVAPTVTERGLPWINFAQTYRGFRVITLGTTQTNLVLNDAPDIGSQIVITRINISTSTQIRSYPYSASAIALGD